MQYLNYFLTIKVCVRNKVNSLNSMFKLGNNKCTDRFSLHKCANLLKLYFKTGNMYKIFKVFINPSIPLNAEK